MTVQVVLDDKKPADIALEFANIVGNSKVNLPLTSIVILGFLAGVYIAFGGLLSTTVTFDMASISGIGLKKLISGASFSVGLMLVVIAGAELFTGNNLIILSAMSKKISWKSLLKNWVIVYLSNFVGALTIALLFYFSGLWKTSHYTLGVAVIETASSKVELLFTEALFRAIGCNWLVCLAIWMAWGSRSITAKILAILFPIMGFVAIGFEHCIANMYFIPSALFLKLWAFENFSHLDLTSLSWSAFFLQNLLPVTIGNILGGSVFVGLGYWYSYVKPANTQK